MKKNIIIIFTLIFIFILTISSYAIDMNLSDEESSSDNADIIQAIVEEQQSNEDLNEISEDESNNNENEVETTQAPSSTVTSDSTNENFFTPSNIVNVILIAVGIVIIFLGIAILIRIK